MPGKKQDVSIIVRATDKVSRTMDAVQKRVDRFTLKKSRLEFKALGRAARLDAIGSKFSLLATQAAAFSAHLRSVTTRLTLLTGATAGASFALTNAFAKAGDNAAKTADKLGLPIETLQEWRFAAERADISAQTFDTAIQRLGRRAGEFAITGSGTAAPAFEALGLSVDIASGNLSKLQDLFPVILDGLGKIEDANKRNAIAMKLFDTEGVKLVNLAIGGSKNLDSMAKSARNLGAIISEDTARASESFVDRMTDFRDALAGVRNIIGEKLMPVIKELADRFINFLTNNRADIIKWAERFAEQLRKLPTFLKSLPPRFKEFMKAIQPITDALKAITDRFGLFNTVVGTFLIVTVGPLIISLSRLVLSFFSLGGAVLQSLIGLGSLLPSAFKLLLPLASKLVLIIEALAVRTLLLAGPFIILAAKVALVVGVFVLFFKIGKKLGEFLLQWEPFNSLIENIGVFIAETKPLEKAFAFIQTITGKINNALSSSIGKIKEFVSTNIGSIGNKVDSALSSAKSFIRLEDDSNAVTLRKNIIEKRERQSQGRITMDFKNLPKNTLINTETEDGLDIFLDPGFNFR